MSVTSVSPFGASALFGNTADLMTLKPLLAVVTILLPVLVACTTPSAATTATPPASDAKVVAALIVKPRLVTSQPAAVVEPMRKILGQSAGVRYLRPMSGDAHVVHLTAPAQPGDVPQLIERLRRSGAFENVELDSMMKIQ